MPVTGNMIPVFLLGHLGIQQFHGINCFAFLKFQKVYYGLASGLPRAFRDLIDFFPVEPAKVCEEKDIVVG